MLPLDIICIVSFSVFLLIPGGVKPTPDQRINLFVAIVTVLVAQVSFGLLVNQFEASRSIAYEAAFNISARPLLPGVSHITMMDVHSTICFM